MAALLARPSDQERWSYPANLAPLTPAVLTRTTILARLTCSMSSEREQGDQDDRACGFSLSYWAIALRIATHSMGTPSVSIAVSSPTASKPHAR